MTRDIIRLRPKENIMGYLYIWLQSIYANRLIISKAYGSVVPFLKDRAIQDKINNLALEAGTLRYEAYNLEQTALHIIYKD